MLKNSNQRAKALSIILFSICACLVGASIFIIVQTVKTGQEYRSMKSKFKSVITSTELEIKEIEEDLEVLEGFEEIPTLSSIKENLGISGVKLLTETKVEELSKSMYKYSLMCQIDDYSVLSRLEKSLLGIVYTLDTYYSTGDDYYVRVIVTAREG